MTKIHELPENCLVCGSVEVLPEPIIHELKTDNKTEVFGIYLCADHSNYTSGQCQDIISDNINMATFVKHDKNHENT